MGKKIVILPIVLIVIIVAALYGFISMEKPIPSIVPVSEENFCDTLFGDARDLCEQLKTGHERVGVVGRTLVAIVGINLRKLNYTDAAKTLCLQIERDSDRKLCLAEVFPEEAKRYCEQVEEDRPRIECYLFFVMLNATREEKLRYCENLPTNQSVELCFQILQQ